MIRTLPAAAVVLFTTAAAFAQPDKPFGLRAIDARTGRPIPLVEFRTTSEIPLHTDSSGWVAFDEPGLMGREVYFTVASPGYEVPKDGFGYRGMRVVTTP